MEEEREDGERVVAPRPALGAEAQRPFTVVHSRTKTRTREPSGGSGLDPSFVSGRSGHYGPLATSVDGLDGRRHRHRHRPRGGTPFPKSSLRGEMWGDSPDTSHAAPQV